MNLDIQVKNNELLVSMRTLYGALEIKTRFNDWSKRMFEYGFEENVDYIGITQKRVTAQGNTTTFIDYLLKLDVAKEIAMLQRNEIGRNVRKYFIQKEKEFRELKFEKLDRQQTRKLTQEFYGMLPDYLKQESLPAVKRATVVNKAISNFYGFEKMLKKSQMGREMLEDRQKVEEDYNKLYEILGDNHLVAEILYKKYSQKLLESKED